MHRTFYIVAIFIFLAGSPEPMAAAAASSDLTVSWSITITSKKGGDMGIGETYNGGVETFFAGAGQARIRLVSLMRIQSIFMSSGNGQDGKFTIVKESGKDKYVTSLTGKEWELYNKKYAGAEAKLTDDTVQILHHVCKKATIVLKDGKVITAWYAPTIQEPMFSRLEPAFTGIPGLVLKYEYIYRKKTISYTATTISRNPISREVFAVPAAGADSRGR